MDECQFIHEIFVRLTEEKVRLEFDEFPHHIDLLSESFRLSNLLCKTFSSELTNIRCSIDLSFLFKSIIDYLGYEELGNEFEEYFYQLCQDSDWKIRSTLPMTIIDVRFLLIKNVEMIFRSFSLAT